MPAKCIHPHQTCSGSNSSYVKISCSSCGAVLYQNYLTQFIDHLPDHIQEGLMQELVNRGHARLEDEPMESPDQPRRYCRQQ